MYLFELPPTNQMSSCGCFFHEGKQQVKKEELQVPLKHIDYELQIVNSLLHLTQTQKYYNPSENYREVYYSFPIRANSSIYEFWVEFGDVRIEGIVKEKQKAKKEYDQAKSQGRQAVLGSFDNNSKEVMRIQIGNIPPKTQFVVCISFMQEVLVSSNTFYKVQIPASISPMIMNSSSVESWSFKVEIKTEKKITFYQSPYHDLFLLSKNQAENEILLVMQQSCQPNKDFLFLYSVENFHLPSCTVGRTDTSQTAMISLIPKFCSLNLNDAYQAEVENRGYEINLESVRGDYVFILDCSYSMSGLRIKKAKEALVLFLQSLPANSYFNIVAFGDNHRKIFQNSLQYNEQNLSTAIKIVKAIQADLGGTNIYSPLQSTLSQTPIKSYPKQIFLLTDGQVYQPQKIYNLISKNINTSRVHAIGIGSGASFELIKTSAEKGKGKHIMIDDNENPMAKIIQILELALTPLITNIKLEYDISLVESILPNPLSMPHILRDELVNFYITFKKPLEKKTLIIFQYEDSVTKIPYQCAICVEPNSSTNMPLVDKMAHFKIVRALEEASKFGVKIQDRMLYVKVVDYKAEAIKASVKYQILSEYTSFLCTGKQLIDGQFQEYQSKVLSDPFMFNLKNEELDSDCLLGIEPQNSQIQNQILSPSSSPISLPPNFTLPSPQYQMPSPVMNCFSQSNSQNSLARNMQPEQNQSFDFVPKNSFTQKNAQDQNIFSQQNVGMTQPSQNQVFDFFGDFNQVPTQKPSQSFSFLQNQFSKSTNKKSQKLFLEKSLPKSAKKKSSQQTPHDAIDLFDLSIQPEQNLKNQIFTQEYNFSPFDQYQKCPSEKSSPSIQFILSLQKIDGHWDNLQLAKKLFKNWSQAEKALKLHDLKFVITYIVVNWIKKYYPEKQYRLVLKKGQDWLERNAKQGKTQSALLSCIDQCI